MISIDTPPIKKKTLHTSSSSASTNSSTTSSVIKHPRFIFGHSTGHAGSTTVHKSLSQPGCPWETFQSFEERVKGEAYWTADPDCNMTKNILVPHLLAIIDEHKHKHEQASRETGKSIDNTTFIDMGHFHNRGRVIECLADHFREQAAFVRVRRDRYSIANSFAKRNQTPCILANKLLRHPGGSVCPRSGEDAGLVNLPVPSDLIWDAMTPFQRFLK